jgi:hypothetical protein
VRPRPEAEAEAEAAEAAPAAETPTVGEDGLVLAVGQTGSVDGTRVFLSRIDEETGEARLMVVGEGPATVATDGEPLALGEGCALTLVGIAERRAYLGVACGE